MPFENVKMDPIAQAFADWSKVNAAAGQAAHAVDTLKGYRERNMTVRPVVHVTVELVGGDGRPYSSSGIKFDSLNEHLTARMSEGLADRLMNAAGEMAQLSEDKRHAFLRATLAGISGE